MISKSAKKETKQKFSFSLNNLSPAAKKALIASVSALAGGAIGSYVAGEKHRTIGALAGAGLAGGLALSAGPLQKGVSAVAGKALPPPKSKLSGLAMPESLIAAGLLSAPAAAHFSLPSAQRMRDILSDVVEHNRTGSGYYRSRHAGSALRELDRGMREAVGGNPIKNWWNMRRAASDAANYASATGLFHDVHDGALRLNLFRRLMSNRAIRRGVSGGSLLAALAMIGSRIHKRYKENSEKIERGWS